MTEQITTEQISVPDDLSSITPKGRAVSDSLQGIDSGKYAEYKGKLLPHLGEPGEIPQLMLVSGALKNYRTADEIADMLHNLGFKGDRSIINSCPIANFARAQLGAEVQMDDRQLSVKMRKHDGWWNFNSTPAMKEFIKKFDEGYYPHLVA